MKEYVNKVKGNTWFKKIILNKFSYKYVYFTKTHYFESPVYISINFKGNSSFSNHMKKLFKDIEQKNMEKFMEKL